MIGVEKLYVYDDDQLVGIITKEPNGDYWFQYDKDWVACEDAFPLSLTLPLREEPFDKTTTENYFEQLLPEGDVEEALIETQRLPSTFHFLKQYGADCAGKVRILSSKIADQQTVKKNNYSSTSVGLKEIPIDDIYDTLEERELLATFVARKNPGYFSIAGGQDKFVGIFSNGRIYLVQDGRPTTHIFKAPIQRNGISDTVWNEYFCLTLAAEAGLNTVQAQVLPGRYPLLAVYRYDRLERDGKVQRIHQFDAAQALGIKRSQKYEDFGGPSFKQIYNLIQDIVFISEKINAGEDILSWLAFNLLIGNNDTHAKNISFCTDGKKIILAPFYDLLSTAVYPSLKPSFAFKIGGSDDFAKMDGACLAQLGKDLNLRPGVVEERFKRMIEILPDLTKKVAAKLKSQGGNVPVVKKIVNLIHQRCQKLKAKL